jgi:hypothetical protein
MSKLSGISQSRRAFCLPVPASEVGVGQFHRFHALPRCNHRDQFRPGGGRWRRQRLPPFFPEALLLRCQVSLPVLDIACFLGLLNHEQLAPVPDQRDLDLQWRESIAWSLQRKASCCDFAAHLTMPVVAPRLPWPDLLKGLFGFVLVGSQQCDNLSSFELELRQEFCRHAFAVHHDPLHQRLACRLLIAAEHLR